MRDYSGTIALLRGCLLLSECSVLQAHILDVLPKLAEQRTRHYIKGAHGYFMGSWSDGNGGGHGGAKALKKALDKSARNGIINTGARYGAINSQSERASLHAERYYGLVRSMRNDVASIAKNTGIKESNIQRVKNHLFIEMHDLGGEKPQRFYPDYEIAQSWQRLVSGKGIQKHDIILLKHEYSESRYMEKGYSQQEAHDRANRRYNYREALLKRGN